MPRYRSRTNDYVINGKVFDIYTIKKSKGKAKKSKSKLKNKYKNIRIIKRTDGYNVIVRK